MNINEYIESGIIEDYCLGLLEPAEMQFVATNAQQHSEIKNAIASYEKVLIQYASAGITAGYLPKVKNSFLQTIEDLEQEAEISAENLPLINKYSEAGQWLKFVKSLLPAKLAKPFLIHRLPAKDGVEQFVFWTSHNLPHETHDNEQESILLLEGCCRCFIDDKIIELQAGDFLSIPLYKQHNVEILNGPVMAVIQRVKVA